MAWSVTSRGTYTAAWSSNNYTSGSFTPDGDALLLVVCQARGAGVISAISGHDGGSSWVELWEEVDAPASGNYMQVWGCFTGSSPSSGTITVTMDYYGSVSLSVLEIQEDSNGVDVSGTVANAFGTRQLYYAYNDTTLQITLGAFDDANNLTFVWLAQYGDWTYSYEAGFTEIGGLGTTTKIVPAYKASEENTIDCTVQQYIDGGLWGVEIKQSAAAGGYTIEMGAGTYTYTGSDASLEYGHLISMVAGSYSHTGSDVSLEYGHLIDIESGAYSLTGSDISLLKDSIIGMNSGSYILTGSDINLELGYLLSVDGASYSLTGSDVSLKRGYQIDIDAGSYAHTGQDVVLTVEYRIPIEAGTYTLTGSNVDLRKGRTISVDSGSYIHTGSDVSLLYGYLLGMGAGSYVITGSDIDLEYSGAGYSIDMGTGSYALTGSDVGLKAGRLITIDSGAYALTGSDMALKLGRLIEVGAGSYVLTGSNIDLTKDFILTVENGTYVLTGSDITLTYSGSSWSAIKVSGIDVISGKFHFIVGQYKV